MVTTERAKHFYSPQDVPVTLYSDADEWEVSAGPIAFLPVGQSYLPSSLWSWLLEHTVWAQVSGQGHLGRGNEENICLVSGLREAHSPAFLRQSSALAQCLGLSVLVLIWADETTEELCSHHPCPCGSQRQGYPECFTSHGRWPCLCPPAEGWAPADLPGAQCGPHRAALPGILKHSQPRTFLAGLPSCPPLPLHFSSPQSPTGLDNPSIRLKQTGQEFPARCQFS